MVEGRVSSAVMEGNHSMTLHRNQNWNFNWEGASCDALVPSLGTCSGDHVS